MGMKKAGTPRYLIKTALLAFVTSALAIVPFTAAGGGVLMLSDDFNYQQLVFSILCGDFFKQGNFGWSFVTDLGSSVIGSYSFYNLASPFSLLTVFLPSGLLPYTAAPLLILKYCTAAVLAFLFLKRFVKEPDTAVFGAMLYAFCGFQTMNLLFPFHDAVALFPLMLIGLEALVTERRRGVFALSCAVCCALNYYFFFGQILFALLYFLFRFVPFHFAAAGSADNAGSAGSAGSGSRSARLRETGKRCLRSAAACIAEGALGMGTAAVILLPSVLSVLQNPRLSSFTHEIFFHWTRIITLLQAYFLPADVMGAQNYFLEKACTSCAIGLPLVAMALVFAFLLRNRKSPLSFFLAALAVISFVPFLNSAFSLFNAQYYARWFYMAALMFALASALALDGLVQEAAEGRREASRAAVKGALLNFVAVLLVVLAEAALVLFFKAKNHPYLSLVRIPVAALYAVFGLLCAGGTLLALRFVRSPGRLVALLTAGVLAASSVTMAAAIFRYKNDKSEKIFYDGSTVNPDAPLSERRTLEILTDMTPEKLSLPDEQNYRLRTVWYEEGEQYPRHAYDNLSMTLGVPSVNSFISTVSGGIFEFYRGLGIPRTVDSPGSDDPALAALLSCRYYLTGVPDGEKEPVGRYTHSDGTVLYVYEYDDFLPIGFTYYYYITPEELAGIPEALRPYALLNALVLTEEDAQRLFGAVTPLSEVRSLTFSEYSPEALRDAAGDGAAGDEATGDGAKAAASRETLREAAASLQRNGASTSFTRDKNGFRAEINTDRRGLAYFSIPADSGWKAQVNGVPTEIYSSNGMMAVLLESGRSEIVFRYETPGLKAGAVLSVLCFSAVILRATLPVPGRKGPKNGQRRRAE